MKTLVLANQKGGVGKSAVATLLAHYFRKLGCRVLAIDLDHQGNFSDPLRKSQRAVVGAVPASALLTQANPAIPEADFVLVAAQRDLSGLERQPSLHNDFANHLRAFLKAMDERFDVCLIDTNPNPDIRMVSALASADCVLSPIQLNQEAMDGVNDLLNHPRVGVRKITMMLNPKLRLIGLLPVMVEATPFQRENFLQLVQKFNPILISYGPKPGQFVSMPRRSAVAEAQAEGLVLWERKKTAARDAWLEIERAMVVIAKAVLDEPPALIAPATTAPPQPPSMEQTMALQLDDLDLLPPTGGANGTPLRISLDTIDEDPDQPRQEFDEQSFNELAETIRERGVRQPVSVRTHPTKPGRWMLNFGARRLRACQRVGLSEIPAFVDQTASSMDQFIENEQRKGLTPLEIALFVQRAMNQGQTQADIARAIGKSRQYVTLATALIDAPDWLMGAYREGRCRGLAELYELRKLAGQHPQYVEAWASDREAITRDNVAALRTDLAEGSGSVRLGTSALIESVEASLKQGTDPGTPEKSRASTGVATESQLRAPAAPFHAPLRLLASLDGVEMALSILQRPAQAGQVYVLPVLGGQMQAVQASRLILLGWSGT